MFHVLKGADIGKTKIQEDKMRDRLLHRIRLLAFNRSNGLVIEFLIAFLMN